MPLIMCQFIEANYKGEFFHYINSMDDNMKFTAETTRVDGAMPFLDTLVIPQNDGSLSTTVYRKPTHTNQYLQWDSHHAISNKYSVISSLLHRAKGICSTQEQLEEEQTHIHRVLSSCNYPGWAINRMKLKTNTPVKPKNSNNSNKDTKSNTIKRSYITVPYMKGLSESIKNMCKRYGIQVYFKSVQTIKDQLVVPKDKEHITKRVA